MSWISILGLAIILTFFFIIFLFCYFSKNKTIGKKFFKDNDKPFNKIAPQFYYDKQQMYRKYYGFLIGIHYFLLFSSISLTTITIYMVMDTNINETTRIAVSVLAAISTTLQSILKFDKLGEAYISAMRVIEQAILEYEEVENAQLEILLSANIKAEEIIHNIFQ